MYKKGHKNEDYSIWSLLLAQPENFKLNDCSVASSHILSSRSERWCNIFLEVFVPQLQSLLPTSHSASAADTIQYLGVCACEKA